MVKNLPARQENIRLGFDPWVRKIPWRKGLATHSSILAWRIPWMEEPRRPQGFKVERDLATEHTRTRFKF